MPEESREKVYDVAVIGGGLVGASLACALSQLGLSTAVIEAVPAKAASQPSYDDRTLALSASSCNILAGLSIWPLLEQNATAIRQISVSELKGPGRVELNPAEMGLAQFGHVVEARVFGAAVMQQIRQLPNVEFHCPASVSDLTRETTSVRITFEQEEKQETISAKLVVGADGAGSFIRQSLGIETETHDYGSAAIICNFMPAKPHCGRAFECFTPSGPLAVLPHIEGRCGLVWCVETDQVARLTEMAAAEFLCEAQSGFEQAFGQVLGEFSRPGSRTSYPLRLVRAEEDIGSRTVIMGNAAHAIHPIGAQGFNLGLRDVAVLAEVLLDAQNSATDIGDETVLARYSEWRKTDHSDTIAWSDGLARIFANPIGLVALGRTAGLVAHALFPPLRRRMAARAMGFRGRIPSLAQGHALRADIT